jgi:trehalose/maltose transport system substrate-binding protein
MSAIRALAVAIVLLAALPGCQDRDSAERGSVTITVSCGAVGRELELCREGAERWSAQTGHQVELISTPNSATERLALYQQLLGARASDVDVLQIDVVWPGILADHLLALGPQAGDAVAAHFPAMVANNTVDGRLVALPWFTDAGLLFYRRDLLERHGEPVPATWEQLEETAARIQAAERAAGNDRMWGFVWQGRAYEGLTCDALEWIASQGGGTILDPDGRVTVDNPAAVAALERAAGWVGTISPPGVLNYAEEEARGVFQSGHAVFMRNWPYAWALAQGEESPVRDRVGVAALPAGGDGASAAALGGWQLAVSRYSAHPEAAADLALFLSGAAEQKRRAIAGALNPTIPALYEDSEVLAANPFFGDLYETFRTATPRPSNVAGTRYNELSFEFYNAVFSVLSGQRDAADALSDLQTRLETLLSRER